MANDLKVFMEKNQKSGAIIFDMGGVLLRTEDRRPREKLSEQLDMSYDQLMKAVFESETSHAATIGLISEEDHWQAIAKTLHIPQKEIVSFRSAFWSGDHPDKELLLQLQKLRTQFKIGLLSNAWPAVRSEISEAHPGLLDIFDVSFFSSEVGLKKPDLAFYRLLLEKLEVEPSDAIFFDDMVVNVQAANEIGIKGVQFINSGQTQAALMAWVLERKKLQSQNSELLE